MTTVALMVAVLLGNVGVAAADLPRGRLVDLTHPFDEGTVYWPTAQGFTLEKEFDGVTEQGYYYAANKFCAAEHGGTHVDAPLHFNAQGRPVDAIPFEQLIGPAIVVDVSEKAADNRDYQVQVKDLRGWEERNGRIQPGTILFLRTGFGVFWPDRKRYLGTDERGKEAVAKLHFPGLRPDAARWLVEERAIGAIGIDTASIDFGQSKQFESHVALFAKQVPAFENVANLDQLPAKGFTIVALPMKIRGGSGAPLRIVAILPP